MACDICGKTGTHLYPLMEQYKTKDIQVVCPDCDEILTRKKSKLLTMMAKMQAALLKRFMQERRAKKYGLPGGADESASNA